MYNASHIKTVSNQDYLLDSLQSLNEREVTDI